jgi:hypothetical protein
MMGGAGAHQQRSDFWQYAQRRPQPTSSSAEVVRPGLSWDRKNEIVGSAEQYRSVVNLSRPLNERKKMEGGWPIDL